MKRLIYMSAGTDEQKIACATVEEAVNCFRVDADAALDGGLNMEITLTVAEISDEQLAKLREV